MPFLFENRENRATVEPKFLLKDFIKQLEIMFQDIINGKKELSKYTQDINTEENFIENAFSDLIERQVFFIAITNIRDTSMGNISDSGLTGVQLNSKMGLLELYSGLIKSGVKKAIKYLLDLINSILDSIKFALGTVGGAVIDQIKEFKDMVKTKIELANNY